MQWGPSEIAEHSKCANKVNVRDYTDKVHEKQTMSQIDRKHPQALELSQEIKEQKFQMV